DARERRHLPLVQLQLVGQEPERPAHAERAAAEPLALAVTLALAAAAAPAAPAATGPAARRTAATFAVAVTVVPTPPGHHVSMHVRSPFSFRRGHQLPAGFRRGRYASRTLKA